MENERASTRKDFDQVILASAVCVIGAVASATLFARRKKKRVEGQGSQPGQQQWVPTLPGTDPHNSSTFYQLRLSRIQYETLRKHGGSTLVFQFYYPKESDFGSPTLYSYNMKKDHVPTGKPPAILSYGEPSKEPLRGRAQVLGDQQVEISELDKLIRKVTKNTGNYFNLVFDPIFLDANPHATYKISVDGSDSSVNANPSPPG